MTGMVFLTKYALSTGSFFGGHCHAEKSGGQLEIF